MLRVLFWNSLLLSTGRFSIRLVWRDMLSVQPTPVVLEAPHGHRRAQTTHQPHRRPSSSGGILGTFLVRKSRICKVLIFLRVWSFFSHALCIHFVRQGFGRCLWDSIEIAQNRQQTKYAEHASKKIRPTKRIRALHFPEKRAKYAPPPVLQFCTRDVDHRFCGGGAWISRSDPWTIRQFKRPA